MGARPRTNGLHYAPYLRTLEFDSMLYRLQEKGGFSKIHLGNLAGAPSCRVLCDRVGMVTISGPPKFISQLFADAELPDDCLIALGIVSFEVVEQATPLADQHEQAAARAVVLLVRFEVIRQLANAFTNNGDLNLGTPRVRRMRLILVNDRFLLLSG